MMLRKMLATMVDMDPGVVGRIVENLLKRLSDRERIMVYLNPSDVTMIEESKESLMDSIRGVKFFELLSDDHVDKGSCLIETNLGIYDARWRTQLEQVSSEVQNLLMESMASDGPNG
jgi:flagellar assembly protein FliH